MGNFILNPVTRVAQKGKPVLNAPPTSFTYIPLVSALDQNGNPVTIQGGKQTMTASQINTQLTSLKAQIVNLNNQISHLTDIQNQIASHSTPTPAPAS